VKLLAISTLSTAPETELAPVVEDAAGVEVIAVIAEPQTLISMPLPSPIKRP